MTEVPDERKHTDEEVYKKGDRIEKVNSAPGDAHADGAQGRIWLVYGPISGMLAYAVEWDDMPDIPVHIGFWRVRKV